jgi:hypothetical protein
MNSLEFNVSFGNGKKSVRDKEIEYLVIQKREQSIQKIPILRRNNTHLTDMDNYYIQFLVESNKDFQDFMLRFSEVKRQIKKED